MNNKKVMLLPEQVEEHKQELNDLKQKLVSLTTQKREMLPSSIFSGSSMNPDYSSDSIDSSLLMELSRINNRIHELENILSSYDIVTEINNDTITVGTTFSFKINDLKEMTLTLVEKFGDHNNGLISLDSPIGSAVYGKTIGDSFTYKLFNGNESSGVITNIIEKNIEQPKELKK